VSSADLDALRARIDEVDERLVALLAERKALVEAVAQKKRARSIPVYHPAREEDLISRRRAQAVAAGVDPDLVEDVLRRVMRASRVSQAKSLSTHAVRPGATVVVVGGGGGMGRVIAGWFDEAGYRVRVLEQDGWDRAEELCEGADLAVLAVPIDVTAEVATRLGPVLPATCVLADITSVKVRPLGAMLAAHGGPVVGLHPMFGPTTHSMDRQIVVMTPGRDDDACRWVVDQLAAWGAVVVEATAEEHDEATAVVQALRHFATFALGQFLHRMDVDLQRTLEFSAPIYRLELGMVGRLFAQDAGLYAEIVFADETRRALLERFLASVATNGPMLQAGDKRAFVDEFRRISEWFGPFAEQALRESSWIIDKMVERF
jgi:chorismate mutase/prephenate dehydrogenase